MTAASKPAAVSFDGLNCRTLLLVEIKGDGAGRESTVIQGQSEQDTQEILALLKAQHKQAKTASVEIEN